MRAALIFALFVLVAAASGQSTANNTSACPNSAGSCNGVGSMPLLSNPLDVGAQTPVVDPLPTNVSPLSIKSMLYSGANPWVACVYLPWFSNSATATPPLLAPYNGHVDIGMNENTSAQTLLQLQTMKNEGCDVVVIDYYGCSIDCPTPQSDKQAYNLAVTQTVIAQIAANSSTTPKLLIMLDNGAIDGTGTGQCPSGSGMQSCLITAIETQMAYISSNWTGQSYYQTNPKDGNPPVMYFITPSLWPGANFSTIYAAVAAAYPGVDFMDQNAGAFGESGIMGGYPWPQPNPWSATNQFCWDGNCTFDYLGDFYSTAQAQTRAVPDTITCGVLFKGFDDANASWGQNRVIAQQCGGVLALTAAKIASSGYSSSKQISCLLVATWNDYEEGHEVEGGVDNCLSVNQPSIAGGTMSWSLATTDATYGSAGTFNKLQIWTGTTGPTSLFADNISPTATSHAAPALSAGEFAWVYAVGQPLIQNRLSPPVLSFSVTSRSGVMLQ